MEEKVYLGIYKDGIWMGVFQFNSIEDVTISFVDGLHDLGYVLKKLTQKDYEDFADGDELNAKDFIEGYYTQTK